MTNPSTYQAFRERLSQGMASCQKEVSNFLSQINAKKHLNIFLEVFENEAIENAIRIDAKIKTGTQGKLAGMVIALKDNICYAHHKVSASSKILEQFESVYSSTAVERLLAEDAIIIGRVNCDEFAMGSSNENSAYGPVLNPLDETLVPGGSSGGSAAAVAAGVCHVALGSDTGGSIRQPASFCGVIGLRPSYGRISRYGLLTFASSMDQIGTITHNIEDAALLLEVMSGKDEFDSTVSSKPVPEYSKLLSQDHGFKIATLDDCIFHDGVDIEIRERFKTIISELESHGNTLVSESFPYLDYMIPSYAILAMAEASSNLSRFAGMTYGYRSKHAENLETTITASRTEGFGEEVKRRIMLGTFVLSEGYYDAYYSKAQKVRNVIKKYTDKLLEANDFLLLPVSPSTAFKLHANTKDPIAMYLADIFTIQSALAGVPSISLPLGWHSNGMPFGIQIISRMFEEEKLLAFSEYLMDKFSRK